MSFDNIKVVVRVRPLNSREQNLDYGIGWQTDATSVVYYHPETKKINPSIKYTFDRVFCEDEGTPELYAYTAKNIITASMDGFNGTIFAYGQTASGKTHTMHGSRDIPGIIPLSVRDIFAQIESTPDREFLLRVSYIEIYNEVIKDLLSADGDNLKIHEDVSRGIFVGGLREEIVTRPEQVFALMQSGEARRHVGKTNMNERSSRSHTIFRMVIESREKKHKEKESALARGGNKKSFEGGAVKVSSLNLVDLAGSERTAHTGAEGVRLKEGGHINKSLLTLGTVIAKLSEGQEGRAHIPYRDSKLTRILQPALGGNNLTAIICTITPSFIHQEESLSTLKFASRAKTIKNKPTVNEVLDNETMLQRYAKEIHQLKQQLQKMSSSQTIAVEPIVPLAPLAVVSDSTMKELELLRDEKQRTEEEKQRLHEKLEKLTHYIVSSSRDNKQARNRRQTWAPTSTMPRGLLSPTLIADGGLDFDNMDMIVDNCQGPLSPLALDGVEEIRVSKKRSRINQEPAHDEHVTQMREQIEGLENEKASLLNELEGVIVQFRNKERNLMETQRLLEEARSAPQQSAEVDKLKEKLSAYENREESYKQQISENAEQIKRLESDCVTLKQQMKAAEEIKELLASDRSAELEAQNRMKSMQGTIESQASEIQGLKAQLKEAEEIHEEIESKLAEESAFTEERLQELQGQYTELEQQFDALQIENNSLRAQCDEQVREFNYTLAQREEETLQVKKELEMVKANLSLSQSKVKSLQEENTKLSDDIQAKSKTSQFDQTMLDEYTQAITEKESLKMELEELKRAANQSSEIEILREANDNLRSECEQKIATIKKQLDERASLSRELSSSLQEMTSNYQNQIRENDSAQAIIKTLTDELNEIKSLAESARNSSVINDLKNELSQKKLELADLATRLQSYETEDKKKQHDIMARDNITMDLQNKKELLENQLNDARTEFQAQITKQKETIISLESSVADLNAQINVLTTDLSTAKQQAEHAKREAEDARALLENLEKDQNTQKALLGKTETEEQANRKRVNQLQQSLDLAVQEKEKLLRQVKEEQEERKRLESRAYSMEQQTVEASSLNEKLDQLRAENTRLRHLEFVIEDNKRKYMMEKSELESDIVRLRGAASRLVDVENDNEALNKQISETKNRMRDMENSIMSVTNKYKDAEARYQELDSMHGRLKNRLKQVEDQLLDQEENGQKSQLETSELKREISSIQSKLKHEVERAESLEAELRRVEKEKTELDMTITAYSTGVDSVNMQIQQLAADKMTLEHTLQQQIEQYNINVTDLNNARTTIVEMTNEMSQMRAQLKQTSTLLKETEKSLSTAQKELQYERSEAEAAKQKFQSEFGNSKDELNKLRESEKQLKKELKQATQIQNSAEKEKDSKSKDIEKLQTKVQQLEGKLKSSNAENTALIAEKASLEREFKSSKSGHGVLEKENEKLKTSNKNFEQRNKELTTQLKDFEKQNEQLTKSLEKSKLQLDTLQKSFDTTKKELDGMKDNFQKVIEQKLDGDSRVGTLSEELSQRDAIMNQLKHMLEEKERQFEEINTESLQLLDAKNNLEAKLEELSSQHVQLQEENGQMLASLKSLESKVIELEQVRSDFEQTSIRLEQSESEISELKNKFKALVDEKETLSNQLINVSLEIDETKASCEEKIERIESEKSDLIKQLKDRERSKQERDKRIEELMQKREVLENAYNEQRGHFEALIKDLQAQISQKDEQIEVLSKSAEEEKLRLEEVYKTDRSRLENEMQSIVSECEATLLKKDEDNKAVHEQFKTLADQLVVLEKEKEELNSLLATALEEKQKVAVVLQEEFNAKQKEFDEEIAHYKTQMDTNMEAFNVQEQELKELANMRDKFELLERERSGWEKKAEVVEKKYKDLKNKLQAAHEKKVKQKLMQSANKENVAYN